MPNHIEVVHTHARIQHTQNCYAWIFLCECVFHTWHKLCRYICGNLQLFSAKLLVALILRGGCCFRTYMTEYTEHRERAAKRHFIFCCHRARDIRNIPGVCLHQSFNEPVGVWKCKCELCIVCVLYIHGVRAHECVCVRVWASKGGRGREHTALYHKTGILRDWWKAHSG